MLKRALLLAAILALALGSNWLMWQKLAASKDEAARLRSSVQALEDSADRSSRAIALWKRRAAAAEASKVRSAQALERALAASPDWAAMPVPQEVQDAR